MTAARRIALVLLATLPVQAGEGAAKEAAASEPPPPEAAKPRTLDEAFHGRIVSLEKRRVTLFYDFEDAAQLEDFEEARPPRLLDAGRSQFRIEDGRLVLEGSSSIRHRMESRGRIEARFTLNAEKQRDVGAVVTEPVLSDFYVVYDVFDYRFLGSGAMHIAACGLHEDEGAEDLSTGLVNYRDIFSGNARKEAPAGADVAVVVRKEGWKEYFRVGRVKGKGSSKGKTADMESYQFGFFVHGTRASFDDLTLVCELSDEYLRMENLRPEIARPAARTSR